MKKTNSENPDIQRLGRENALRHTTDATTSHGITEDDMWLNEHLYLLLYESSRLSLNEQIFFLFTI
jgi:hypothetical protein